jgi:hypothetical protein
MALLFHPEGPAAWQRDLFGYSSPFYYNSTAMPGSTYPCGRSASLSPRLSPAQAPAAGYTYRLAPPRPSVSLRRAVPEVHISRSAEGVLAQCPLGRSFTPDDMRWAFWMPSAYVCLCLCYLPVCACYVPAICSSPPID